MPLHRPRCGTQHLTALSGQSVNWFPAIVNIRKVSSWNAVGSDPESRHRCTPCCTISIARYEDLDRDDAIVIAISEISESLDEICAETDLDRD